MDKKNFKDMWVYIEHDGKTVNPVGLELCCEIRKLCDQSGDKLVGVVAGALPEAELEKVNYPARIPNLKGKMAAKKVAITTITSNDIPGLDRNRIGDPGSPTKVPRMFPPVMPEPGVILDEGSVEANVAKLLGLIND